jgi:hypothetical protein
MRRGWLLVILGGLSACGSGSRVLLDLEVAGDDALRSAAAQLEVVTEGVELYRVSRDLGPGGLAARERVLYVAGAREGTLRFAVAGRDAGGEPLLVGVSSEITLVDGSLVEARVRLAPPGASEREAWRVDLGASRLEADRTSGLIADGIDGANVTLTLVDVKGQPSPLRQATLVALGPGTLVRQPPPTDAAGVARGRVGATQSGSKQVYARVAGLPRVVVAAPPLEFAAPRPLRLAFLDPPPQGLVRNAPAPPLRVAVVDETGAPSPRAAGTVRLALVEHPTLATAYGATRAPLIDGVARFDGLRIDLAGSGFVLRASAPGYEPVDSAPFAVTGGPWQELVLWGGQYPRLVAHPARPGVWLAVTVRGLFSTVDAGDHWHLASGGIVGSVAEVAFAPSEEELIYMIAGGQIYRSDSLGEAWTALPLVGAPADLKPVTIAVDGRDPSTIFVGERAFDSSVPRLYRSSDAGLTAQPIDLVALAAPTGVSLTGSGVIAVGSTVTSLFLLVTVDDGSLPLLFRSPDRGRSFVRVPVAVPYVLGLRTDPRSGLVFHFSQTEIWRSRDDGLSFEPTVSGLPSGFLLQDFELAPNDARRLAVAIGPTAVGQPSKIYTSASGGDSFVALPPAPGYVENLALDASGRRLALGVAGPGVVTSDERGTSYLERRAGLRSVPVRGAAMAPASDGTHVIVSSDTGEVYESLDGGEHIERIALTAPLGGNVTIAQQTRGRVYFQASGRVWVRDLVSPRRDLLEELPEAFPSWTVSGLAVDGDDDDVVYFASFLGHARVTLGGAAPAVELRPGNLVRHIAGQRGVKDRQWRLDRIVNDLVVHRSDDGGATATPLPNPLPDYQTVSFAVAPWPAPLLYVCREEGTYRTADPALGWTRIDVAPAGMPQLRWVSPHPVAAGRLMAGTLERVWHSTDGGDAFVEVTPPGLPPSFVWMAAAHPGDPQTWLLGTPGGLWLTHSAGR